MKRQVLICMMIAIAITGCSQNHFNVPAENIASRVKALGIAPIMVDSDSDIRHPRKDQLISLITETNRKNERHFVRKLKDSGNFNAVALLDGEPRNIFEKLLFRRETRDDASILYNKYFWNNGELKTYLQKNNLDAVMLIVISGLTKNIKVTSIAQMMSMTSDYNHLIMTAQLLDSNGTVLWEYPNFRQRILNYDPIINLEYPDFNEAEANLSPSANVKFRTIEGIGRIFAIKSKDLLLRDTQESEVYGNQFDEMLSLLKFDANIDKSAPRTAVEQPAMRQAPSRPVSAPEVKQSLEQKPQPAVEPPVPETPQPPTDEIVPAKGSTL